jgi:hypothetical protein
MKRTILLLAFALAGCGAPLCQDPQAAQSFVYGCTGSGGSGAFCGCVWENLADRYTCQDMGSATVNTIRDACRSCGGGC